MGAFLEFLTSPPVVKAIAAALALAIEFFSGVDAGAPEVRWAEKLVLVRTADRVVEGRSFRCWTVKDVPEAARDEIGEVFDVPAAIVVPGAVLCRPDVPSAGAPVASLPPGN